MEGLDENKMVEILDTCYQKALNGIPMVSESVNELGDYYLSTCVTTEKAIEKLIDTQIQKCTISGFLTGLGGAIVLPVTLPANVSSVLYIQLRMIASIAYMNGYDVRHDEVKTMVYLCLVGSSVSDILKDVGIKVGTRLAKNLIKQIPGKVLVQINKAVGLRLLTKGGTKGAINLSKCIPIIGGVIGGGFDYVSTKTIATYAKNTFSNN